jgi:hypothetical protein
MDELSEVQLAMVLAMLVLAIPPLVITVLVLLLVASIAMEANKERWALATGASMISARIKRGQM